MIDTQHVSLDRMKEVTTDDDLLSEVEEAHIEHCAECLAMFGQLVLVS